LPRAQIHYSLQPKYAGDIHLIKTQPHMHARGVRLDTIAERANGSRETLIDVPYDFTNQITYETDMVLKPGHSLVPVTSERHRLPDQGRVEHWPAGSLNANTVDDGGFGLRPCALGVAPSDH
jgi:hypothetical protein